MSIEVSRQKLATPYTYESDPRPAGIPGGLRGSRSGIVEKSPPGTRRTPDLSRNTGKNKKEKDPRGRMK